MPIIASDILIKLSGGANLGGAISATDAPSTVNGVFDIVSGAESLAGDVEYRCVYVKNNHATLTFNTAVAFIQSNTPSTDTTCDIGVGTAAISATEQTVANESTAPIGVSFGAASNYGTGYPVGDLAPSQYKAIWIRRTVTPGAAAYNSDGLTLAVQGDTAA